MVDVIVVGAGPAGATAARSLARCGLRVQLLERARFPRNKPCGGGITMRALGRFPWLGAGASPHPHARRLAPLPGGTVRAERGPHLEAPAVLLIRRLEFDDLLARLAVESGAELVEDAWVSQVSADEDGARCDDEGRPRVPRALPGGGRRRERHRHPPARPSSRLGRATSVALDMMEETPNERAASRRARHACGWRMATAAPTATATSFRSAITSTSASAACCRISASGSTGSLRDAAAVRRRPAEPRHAAWATRVAPASRRATSRWAGRFGETARGRVLVAGDAGGFVNAYTAEGIYYAMVSGDLAARAIADAEAEDDPHAGRDAGASLRQRLEAGDWRANCATRC